MADPIRAIQGLPLPTFRGLEFPPYDDASFSFRHNQVPASYPYIPGASHDSTGMEPIEFPFRLYFINFPGTVGIFPALWNKWWKELQDDSAGDLRHPLAGPMDAKVVGGSVQLSGRSTAGVIVDVTFVQTITDPSKAAELETLSLNLEALAQIAADASETAYTEYSQESPLDLFDAVKQLDGMLSRFDAMVDGYAGMVQSKINEMIDFADSIEDHTVYAMRDSLVTLWGGIQDARDALGGSPARPTGQQLLTADMTLDKFAREHGNTMADVMSLNPAALGSPTIAKGTLLRYYK